MEQILGNLARAGARLPAELCHGTEGAAAIPNATVNGPAVHRNGSLILAIKGRPRLADPSDRTPVAERVFSWYRDAGPRCLERLRGPFALALIDSASAEAVLAIDRMGVEQLAWGERNGVLGFGTSAAAVARALEPSPAIHRQALFDFMLGHMVAAPDTAFSGVTKLEPGTYLHVQRERLSVAPYWRPSFTRDPHVDLASLNAALEPTIDAAIERCAPDERTGAFLSGGLDSSTVTGLLSRRGSRNAFSVGFGVDEFNELAFARIASERFGCAHHVYEVVPADVVELVPKIAAAYDEPFGNSSAVPTLCCARLARRHGMDHLLAGDGGDELFGGNARYATQKVFEAYKRIPAWARDAIIEPVADRLDPERAPLLLRKFSSYVRQARIPLPERFETWNLVYREGAASIFEPEFLGSVDPDHALRRMRERWEACPSTDLLDRMLWYDWKLTLADNDLRKVSQMCDVAGVRVSFPLLDEDVVQLSVQVPSAAKISGTNLRTFYKDAMRRLLPAEIIAKEKHGFGLPFGVWLKSDVGLQELVYDSLESLRTRRIVRSDFISRVVEQHRSGHAGYFGYAIWDMLMLEQWLRTQRGSL